MQNNWIAWSCIKYTCDCLHVHLCLSLPYSPPPYLHTVSFPLPPASWSSYWHVDTAEHTYKWTRYSCRPLCAHMHPQWTHYVHSGWYSTGLTLAHVYSWTTLLWSRDPHLENRTFLKGAWSSRDASCTRLPFWSLPQQQDVIFGGKCKFKHSISIFLYWTSPQWLAE